MPAFQAVVAVLSRMSTAVLLLVMLSIASSVGTLLNTEMSREAMRTSYGDFWADFIFIFGFDNVYSTFWFLTIGAFLMLSVAFCLWRNGPALTKALFIPKQPPAYKSLSRWSFYVEKTNLSQAVEVLKSKGWRAVKEYKSKDGHYTYYRRGVLGRIGYWFVHGGVLVMCLAGAVTGFFGYRGTLNLAEGETYGKVWIESLGDYEAKDLPFELRNNAFLLDFYPTGMPSRFVTELTVIRGGDTSDYTLEVNDPLFIDNYGVYQSSFGDGGSDLRVMVREVGGSLSEEIEGRVYKTLKGGDYSFEITGGRPNTIESFILTQKQRIPHFKDLGPSIDYILRGPDITPMQLRAYMLRPDLIGLGDGEGNYSPMYMGLNANEQLGWDITDRLMSLKAEHPDKDWVDILRLVDKESFASMPVEERLRVGLQAIIAAQVLTETNINHFLVLNNFNWRPYTGLLIAYDPAPWLFWLASLLLIIGVLFMLYFPFGRAWVYNQKNRKTITLALKCSHRGVIPDINWDKNKLEKNWS